MMLRVSPFLVSGLLSAASVFAAEQRAGSQAAKAPKTAKAAKQSDLSELLFGTNAPVRTFKIEVSTNELAALKKDNRAYVRGTIREGTNVLADTGVHLKGMGSFRPLEEKPSFAVKFDRYVPDRKYFGLGKIMLNNASQDPTYLAELMGNWMFRDANVPAPRVAHARVTFNGRDLGLYVVVEAENKDFLKRWFGNANGNLYEAYLADIDSKMDQDHGDDTSQADVKRFAAIAKISGASERWEKLHTVLDVDRYISHLVCEVFTSHTDGYARNRNNYRIYNDPRTGKFTFIGHGVDWAFSDTGMSIRPDQNGIVTKAVMTTSEGRKLYKERLRTLFTNIFELEVLTNRVDSMTARLIANARNANETNHFRNCGQEMRDRLVQRWRNITNQLAQPEPVPIVFDSSGIVRLTKWEIPETPNDPANATRDKVSIDGKAALHIATTTNTAASWRTARLLLPGGKYVFEAMARCAGVEPVADPKKGEGAGIRISGSETPRPNKLVGDTPWQKLEYEFTVDGESDEKLFLCELRASKGEVWFDADSLRIVRKK